MARFPPEPARLPGKRAHKIEKVMREFRARKLHSGGAGGPVVRKRKQAVAIALSEAEKVKG